MAAKHQRVQPEEETTELERRIDAMMEVSRTLPSPAQAEADTAAPIDIFQSVGVAPPLEPVEPKPARSVVTPVVLPDSPVDPLLEDPKTDSAVSEILVSEGDALLQAQDSLHAHETAEAESEVQRISGWWLLLGIGLISGALAWIYIRFVP